MRLEIGGRSDTGQVRSLNEDRFAISSPLPSGDILCLVADGLGGYAGGEIAASMAVDEVLAGVAGGVDLTAAIAAANGAIYRRASSEPAYAAMATTIVSALISERTARYAYVGDSRIYLIRDGVASQLTTDHSWVAEEVRAGRLTPEEARRSTSRNLVTRALGMLPEVPADEGSCRMDAGDAIVLCSDGVHGAVTDDEIAAACAEPAEDACRRLISLANQRGGNDNATVIVARVLGDEATATVPRAEGSMAPVSPAQADRPRKGSTPTSAARDGSSPAARRQATGGRGRLVAVAILVLIVAGLTIGWLIFHGA